MRPKLSYCATYAIHFSSPDGAILTKRRQLPVGNKDQLSLTNPRDALHHGEGAANKIDGHSQ